MFNNRGQIFVKGRVIKDKAATSEAQGKKLQSDSSESCASECRWRTGDAPCPAAISRALLPT